MFSLGFCRAHAPSGRFDLNCSFAGSCSRVCRNMVFISYVRVLSGAFLMGLAAAAPMGPVNMLAIRRGVIGGWRHTLACGIGSITGDLILFSLVLFGGHYLFSDVSDPISGQSWRPSA